MRLINFLILVITLLTLHACQRDSQVASENDTGKVNTERETPTKMIEYLVGEWQMDNARGTTGQQGTQGQQNQRMIFTQEARYIEYSGNQKVDSGAYRMHEQLNNLYLESEVNPDPREYEVKFEENRMTLTPNQPDGQGQQNNQPMTFRRISSDTSPQN